MIVGVDVGTTMTKAAAVRRDGSTSATASRRSRLNRLPGGRVEQSLEEVLHSVAEVVQGVLGSSNEIVEAVAFTGQGDGLWLRDEAGRAIRPPISWMDARAASLVETWSTGADPVVERLFRLTRSGVFPGSHAALLAVLAVEEPESLRRARVAGYCSDAVLQRLTGVITVDASDASLPFLDVRTRRYVDEALEVCGVGQWRHLLPDPAPPGTIFALDRAGAELLGLPAGTPVTSGPYDLVACGIGAGLKQPGDGTLVVGTTLSCQVLSDDPVTPAYAEPAGMWVCMPDPKQYLHVMPSMIGSSALDWLLGLLGKEASQLDELIATGGDDPRVRALPFFSEAGERAPFVDARARGRVDGLHIGVTAADIVRATCASIADLARMSFDVLGLDGDLAICGGGSRSDEWVQLFADAIGRPVWRPIEQELGAVGAAYSAWAAMGQPVDVAVRRARRRVFEPSPGSASRCEQRQQAFSEDLAEARRSWAK